MAKILEMPKLSPTMEEGVLATWHKKEGDAVAVDDLLAEVETDKATMEFRAFDKGTLLKILVGPGSKVLLGQPVAIVGEPGEDTSALAVKAGGAPANGRAPAAAPAPRDERADEKAKASAAPPTPPSPSATTTQVSAPTLAPSAQAPKGKVSEGSALDRTTRDAAPPPRESRANGDRVMASPYVRKTARDLGIDLQGATGSGPGGRIVASDLASLKDGKGAKNDAGPANTALARSSAATSLGRDEPRLAEPEVRPLSMMRKTIARRLTESKQTVPHFYLSIDVDAAELVALREQINDELSHSTSGSQKKAANGAGDAEPRPLKVSLNDLIVKASAIALTRVPECNATFTPDAILVHRRVDISVAVAIPDGLVTPVVRNADQKSVVGIATEVRELAARARSKKLKPEEMQDGTFSISNLGMFGIDSFAAVINPPEGAILAVGQVRDVPVVSKGEVVAGKRLAMTLSCDHRVVDGAVGAAFLAELRALLERPMRVLTG
jgi:pyruvate dehydrogenase E2 component (dihydrolipoamide acetyltransferase)